MSKKNMKKSLFGKLVIVFCVLICLAGCAANSQNESVAESSATNNGVSEDCIFNNLEIDSMTISFYDGYNYSTAEAIIESGTMMLEEYSINLDAEQIERVQNTLSDIKVFPYEEYDSIAAVVDNYIICINDSMKISCSSFRYISVDDPFSMYTADGFIQVITDICNEYLAEK